MNSTQTTTLIMCTRAVQSGFEDHVGRSGEGWSLEVTDSPGEALRSAERGEGGVLLMTVAEGAATSPSFWDAARAAGLSVIALGETEDNSATLRLVKSGVQEVFILPRDVHRLKDSLAGAAPSEELEVPPLPGEELVGAGPAIREIRQTIETVGPSDANVFVVGESGTGKELVARALHARSRRASQPFIAINCAALPRDILENELFGHERGAFTGALNRKPGCFELASGGTLFLDEIGEMTSETQAKLLRVIEHQGFRRLGGKFEIRVDVRVIAATNKDVPRSLEGGELRSDLYYRLSVVEIQLPPLRDRRDDILTLAEHFLEMFSFKYGKQITGFTEEYRAMLRSYRWPGNVRELRNAVERAVVICPGPVISLQDLPEKILRTQREITHVSIPIGSTVEEAEKKLILETLAAVGNNKAKAARVLGVSRKTLHNKLNSFALEPGG